MEIKPHYKVAMITYEGFTMLDLIGPAEVFGRLPETFEMHVVSKNHTSGALDGVFKFVSSLSLEQALKETEPFDMIVLPGGKEGTSKVMKDEDYLSFLRTVSERASIVFSICTGSLILAAAGILDGKNATTNKMAYHKSTPNFSKVNWKLHARWVHDDKIITSSGVAAGIDAAFYIMSKVKSREMAEYYANEIEYVVNWDPENDPFAREKDQPPPKRPED